MEIIMENKIYQSWQEPNFRKKSKKSGTLNFDLWGDFSGKITDTIIFKKRYYCWILKGCKLISVKNVTNNYKNSLTINHQIFEIQVSYLERGGSHLSEIIDAEKRDWCIRKILD